MIILTIFKCYFSKIHGQVDLFCLINVYKLSQKIYKLQSCTSLNPGYPDSDKEARELIPCLKAKVGLNRPLGIIESYIYFHQVKSQSNPVNPKILDILILTIKY